MNPVVLFLLVGGSVSFGAILQYFYDFKRIKTQQKKHQLELETKEKESKRKVLELEILRSLSERVGYSLNIQQILEVIIDSLSGLLDFATISYIIPGAEGTTTLKTKVAAPIGREYLVQVKTNILAAFSQMLSRALQPNLVSESISGLALSDNSLDKVESFFNLPMVINQSVVGMITVSSPKPKLYGDEETLILYTILNQVSTQAGKLVLVLENEKRKLSAMIASLTDGVIMVDSNFNLVVANPATFKLLSLQQQNDNLELITILEAIRSKTDLKEALERSINQQSVISLSEFEIGKEVVQIDVEPVKDRFGYLLGAAIILHDVTARHQLEKLREEFIAMMVHELRTPLTTLTYSTDMMLSDLTKMKQDQIVSNLSVIKSTTADMLALVNDLLDVAKIESGKFQVSIKEDDLTEMTKEKVKSFIPLAEAKGVKLTARVLSDLRVPFDRVRIGQVLANLLSNAIKYTDKGQVTLAMKCDQKSVTISISDTGDGIATEDLPKLFNKFEQLGKGKSGERRGTGLGLVISKGIIAAHQGKIWVASAGLGQGATFSFSLPLK